MKLHPRVVVPVVLLALVVVGWIAWRGRTPGGAIAASGTVEATEAQVGFQVPGRIATVAVHEGDLVRSGLVLATLDSSDATARLEQAVAQEAAARAQLVQLVRGSRPEEIGSAQAQRDAAKQQFDDAKLDKDRADRLIQTGAVSQQAWDKAKVAFEVAQSRLQQAEEQYRMVREGPRREQVDAGRAQLAQATAAAGAARVGADNTRLAAPFDGVVTVRHHEPGEVIAAGMPVLTIMNRDDRWVRIYVPEDRVGAVSLGEAATIASDAAHGHDVAGTVVFIASQAEFTPKNVQTREERVKLVYAVKVRITGDPQYVLKPGMPADVRLTAAHP
jgi:HlyD family secretion protein